MVNTLSFACYGLSILTHLMISGKAEASVAATLEDLTNFGKNVGPIGGAAFAA